MTGEAKEALDLSWVSELACGHKVPTEFAQSVVRCPICGTDVRCKQAERIDLPELLDHHQRGYLYTSKPLAELVPALVAEVERLRAQRDEALRIALLPLDGYDLSENFDEMPWVMRALRRIVRIFGDETETQQ